MLTETIKHYLFSLRQFLALPFLALYLILFSIVIGVFYQDSMHMGRQMEQQLAGVLSDRVHLYLDHLFAEPVSNVNAVYRLYQSGKLNPGNAEDQARQLAALMTAAPELSVLNIGFEDGRDIGVNRSLSNGVLHTSVVASGTQPYREVYSVSEDGGRDLFVFKDPTAFIPTTRLWYRHAVQEAQPSWYPMYRYTQSEIANVLGNFAIGYSMPVFDQAKHIVGVINSDLALGQISRYLKLLPLGNGGVAFILNGQNQLVGISTDMPIFRRQQNTIDGSSSLQLSQVDATDSALLKAAARNIIGGGSGSSYLSLQGTSYIEHISDFQSDHGLHLKVVVLLPENQFFPAMAPYIHSMLLFAILIVCIGMVPVALLAIRLSQPLVQMNAWARQLAQGKWELMQNAVLLQDYPVREIQQLHQSFIGIATNLGDTLANLEQRVAERTAELQQVNTNLSELSNTDGMTGIPNRRKFDDVLASEWSRATRTGQPLVIALIDVDWFKKYNDHYGHLAGDDCLRNVATILKSKIRRSGDLVARFGGEEFAIIAPAMNKTKAFEMANLICHSIAEASLPHSMSPFGVLTISVGVALIVPTINTQPETLIQAADEALYHAKDSGRNQVVCAQIEIKSGASFVETDFKFQQTRP